MYAGTVVGQLTTSDEDEGDVHTYTLTDSAGNRFRLDGNTIVQAAGQGLLNHEADASHSITVVARDSGQLTLSQSFEIRVVDVNDAPQAAVLRPGSIREGSPSGTVVGVLSSQDEDRGDDVSNFTLIPDSRPGSELYDIDGRNLVFVGVAEDLDFEKTREYKLTVRSTDSGGLFADVCDFVGDAEWLTGANSVWQDAAQSHLRACSEADNDVDNEEHRQSDEEQIERHE